MAEIVEAGAATVGELEPWAARWDAWRGVLGAGGALFVAEEASGPVGVAVCAEDGEVLVVVDLIVLPASRGRGVGEELLERAEREAEKRGLASVDVTAAASDEDARRFLERHGYRADRTTYRKPLRRGN